MRHRNEKIQRASEGGNKSESQQRGSTNQNKFSVSA